MDPEDRDAAKDGKHHSVWGWQTRFCWCHEGSMFQDPAMLLSSCIMYEIGMHPPVWVRHDLTGNIFFFHFLDSNNHSIKNILRSTYYSNKVSRGTHGDLGRELTLHL